MSYKPDENIGKEKIVSERLTLRALGFNHHAYEVMAIGPDCPTSKQLIDFCEELYPHWKFNAIQKYVEFQHEEWHRYGRCKHMLGTEFRKKGKQ